MDDANVDDLGEPVVRVGRRRRRDAGGGRRIPTLRKYEGKTLDEIGRLLNKDPRDVVMDFVIADHGAVRRDHLDHDRGRRASGAGGSARERRHGLRRARRGRAALRVAKSHPRAWGSFPRILGHYVRDEHLLTLEEAIRKMTSRAGDRGSV